MSTDIQRFSSRRVRLDQAFLAQRLAEATRYRRIAGYFRSSIFELVGEEIAHIKEVKIICNSELDIKDVQISQAVLQQNLTRLFRQAVEQDLSLEVSALLHRDRYRRLYELLSKGNVEVRVLPRERGFLHGKAGIIEGPGGKTCFLGSVNETKNAYASNYEILWEDRSAEGIAWVEEEFEWLWEQGKPLPQAIIKEIGRVAERVEVTFKDLKTPEVPGAALAESPIYQAGEELRPWQRAFVGLFLQHRESYGKVRLLLADEVGLGKTLSMATAAMVGALLDDGPVLIICPSTLTLQWQVELKDRLGIPSAVWHSARKVWIDPSGHTIKTRGAADVVRSPYQIAILSSGLLVHGSDEVKHLLGQTYGTVILDEAHKARRQGGLGDGAGSPNNLLKFMKDIASRTKHLLLGTATPIQTDVGELWDLLEILNTDAEFVLGKRNTSSWRDHAKVLPLIKGEAEPSEQDLWELIRNPLPPSGEHTAIASLRNLLGVGEREFFSSKSHGGLPEAAKVQLDGLLGRERQDRFLVQHNPVLRHTVLRRRKALEQQGLLERVGVNVHPEEGRQYPGVTFMGLGLPTNHAFDLAYEAATEFTRLLSSRVRGAGFMRSMLLQRICSSFASGLATAQRLLQREPIDEDEDAVELFEDIQKQTLTDAEMQQLQILVRELQRPEAKDPKLEAVRWFLQHPTDKSELSWLEHGCIIFSQYYDTASWIAQNLAQRLGTEPVGVYAGAQKSRLYRGSEWFSVERDDLKAAVKKREIRLLVATDAACEGLNLQTLGTLINVDLPWNPARLEQRLGRIKRFGQLRKEVDMLNLVYHNTRDEDVYAALSRRMKDRFDLFGGLPDTIDDDWINNQQNLEQKMDLYIHLRSKARNAFELRYPVLPDSDDRWQECSRVLSRRDVLEKLSKPWG